MNAFLNDIKGLFIGAAVAAAVVCPTEPVLETALAGVGPPFRSGEVVIAGVPENLPSNIIIVKYLPNANLTVVSVESGREWGAVQRFRAKGRRAGLNFTVAATALPDDSLLGYQWNLAAIESASAWETTTGSGVFVAVLDTGLATGGPDGIACTAQGYDVVNQDGTPFDGHGHGTHITGTIAQATNNAIGVAGIAHGACVIPVKVLNDTGVGSSADVVDGIYWAVANGANVINMSLGTEAGLHLTSDPFLDPALDYAYANNVTVVCASGNDGSVSNVSYPAIYPTTIAVGATDYANAVTPYSNRGSGLDIVAPGGDTTRDLNGDGYGDGVLQETLVDNIWGYWFYQGTSMATAHVTAAAALLYAAGTAATPEAVYQALTSTALDIGETGYDEAAGHGLLQIHSALAHDSGAPPIPDILSDAVDLGNNWRWLNWFGAFYAGNDPWIFHEYHGWLYPVGSSGSGLLFWDVAMDDAWWTTDTAYPFVWRFSDETWLWYYTGTAPNRLFYNVIADSWESR